MTDLKEDHKHQFNSRMEEFRNHLNFKSKRAFYEYAKIDSSQFFRVTNGFAKPGFNFFEKLTIAFPDLNLSWFLTGEGEMNLDKLDSFESFDHAQDYISTLSIDDYFALKIFLKSWKNLKSFIADRDDVDEEPELLT